MPDIDEGFFAAYQPPDISFDAMRTPSGEIASPWRSFVVQMSRLAQATREEVANTIDQSLLETGIAFDVYADPEDRSAAWRQDMLPVILGADEWAEIERGLRQRAQLIERLLKDIYGEQRLIREGVVPPELIFGNPAYLHSCQGWERPPQRFLQSYACDLVRKPGGGWRVLSDHPGTPQGHGWVLASRIALAAAYGDVFVDTGVQRLAGYFQVMQERIAESSAPGSRAVMLAPGPADPAYFSHAYLARFLGMPLVQTSDLTQRGGEVLLKTLEGLQRVDVIMRKQHARDIDLLSMPGAQAIGTPGLMQAVATGRLTLANAAGAGVLRNRVLAMLPEAAWAECLGEKPVFDEAPALWLGDPGMAERFLDEPGWVPGWLTAERHAGTHDANGVFASLQTRDARARLIAREGYHFVAERPVRLPTAPAIVDGRLVPAHWAIRCFVTADIDGQYHVLPGGLVHQTDLAATTGLPDTQLFKDLWVRVPKGEQTAPSTLQRRLATVHLARTGRDLLSRTAESLFWLGRYAERAEGSMRVVRAVVNRIREDGSLAVRTPLLTTITAILCRQCGIEPPADRDGITKCLSAVMFDKKLDYGLQAALDGVHRNATMTRGELSHDGWRSLQLLAADTRWRPRSRRLDLSRAPQAVNFGIDRLMAFSGSQTENMTRNFAHLFLEMGRRIERAVQVASITHGLTSERDSAEQQVLLAALLEIMDSAMTYRSRYAAAPLLVPVIDLLVLDETNPRSLAFQIGELERALSKLPGDGPYRSAEHRTVLGCLTDLRMLEPVDLVSDSDAVPAQALHDLLATTRERLLEVADRVAVKHFAKAEVPQASFAMRRVLP